MRYSCTCIRASSTVVACACFPARVGAPCCTARHRLPSNATQGLLRKLVLPSGWVTPGRGGAAERQWSSANRGCERTTRSRAVSCAAALVLGCAAQNVRKKRPPRRNRACRARGSSWWCGLPAAGCCDERRIDLHRSLFIATPQRHVFHTSRCWTRF